MRVTREAVAKEAGVTANTVSCVLNNIRPVSKEVRERVYKAVEKLNYVADFTSRGMKGKCTNQVVVVVDDLTNPFYSVMVSKIEKTFNANGYFVSISSEHNIEKNVSVLLARRVDAVYFCSGVADGHQEQLKRLTDEGVKILMNPKIPFTERKSTIDMATKKATEDAVNYLVSKGHKKIAFFTCLAEGLESDDREIAFIETIKKQGLDSVVIRYNDTNNLATYSIGGELFDKMIKTNSDVTAILAIDDVLAIGAMMQANRLGYKVPNDYSFIGIDGIELSSVIAPKLTTFKCDMDKFADKVYSLLINQLNKEIYEDYVMPLQLVEGDSVLDLTEN